MKIATVGDNCIDYYLNSKKMYAGGNSVNVAVYSKRLGIDSSYIGAIGSDRYGEYMIKQIKSKDVDISHLNILDGKTAVTKVELVDGERVFGEYDEGVLKNFKLSSEQKRFILTHDLVITALWGNVHNDLKYFKESGMIVAFDAATEPFSNIGLIAMENTDYFFFAIDNYGKENLENLKLNMKKIYNKGVKQVIATLGECGSIVYNGTDFTEFGIIKCDVVDTMGAGDSYIAGYLKGVLEKRSIEECMRLGAKNASKTIQYNGAW
ncbi:MAG: fructoselysine 6-kinase [Candidatus Cloacimonadota bacterium]|nr:MAG: fructoselysine 6-kinase [Candidatus Cloacimonadota bacterium]PIE77509.1 MAG: fructoselysine 6-kinase [Candidatus Delongbacteria bacterium]